MDCVDICQFSRCYNAVRLQVTQVARWWPNTDGLICQLHMQRLFVCLRVDSERFYA